MIEKNIRKGSYRSQSDTIAKLQPQATDIEKAILGGLMIDRKSFDLIEGIISTQSFYEPRHQEIFTAIRNLYSNGNPIDTLTVTEELSKLGYLEEIGGPAYIAELSSGVASSANIEYHANIIAQKALARQLILFSNMITTKAYDETTDIDDLMQEAEQALFELSKQHVRRDYTTITPVMREAIKEISDAAGCKDGIVGITTGFKKLDQLTCGWQPSDLIIIAGRPAMGKTSFALSMAKTIGIDFDIPLAFFSLEMSNKQLVKRIISNNSQVRGEAIRSGQLRQDEWDRIDKGVNKIYGKPFYMDETPGLSIYDLRSKARRLVKEQHVQIIIIDYLQLMSASTKRFSTRQDEVSLISRSLKGLAKELNIPIIALSQLNRGVDNRDIDNKRPQLSDIRESGAIEQDADVVVFVHRPEYYGIETDKYGHDLHGAAEIIVAKQRSGATGDILLKFEKEFTSFADYDCKIIGMKSNTQYEFMDSDLNIVNIQSEEV